MPDSEHVEVALSKGKALVFCARQPEAECQHGEREGEEAGDDKKQRPQSEAARGTRQCLRWALADKGAAHPRQRRSLAWTDLVNTLSACSRR